MIKMSICYRNTHTHTHVHRLALKRNETAISWLFSCRFYYFYSCTLLCSMHWTPIGWVWDRINYNRFKRSASILLNVFFFLLWAHRVRMPRQLKNYVYLPCINISDSRHAKYSINIEWSLLWPAHSFSGTHTVHDDLHKK